LWYSGWMSFFMSFTPFALQQSAAKRVTAVIIRGTL
jgi:hypothetical protein